MSGKAVFIYHPNLEKYCFKPDHPFNPTRLRITVSLLQELGLLKENDIVIPRLASMEELLLAHDQDYIRAVENLSNNFFEEEGLFFGIGTEDNPVFSDMHQASSLVVGATLTAGEEIMEGRANHAISIAGGLHHAGRRQASGFCIYNDINVAIRYLCRKYHIRVFYIDTDAHHGDGVQWEFYDDPNVLTVSFHENGRFLFPGTGWLNERGKKEGYGYCVNVPLEPYTDDNSFLECFREVVPPLIEAFQPDLIISQNGCDGHFYDSLTHINLSISAFQEIPRLVHQLAHAFSGGKWLAVGGGGYDPFRVVARAWVLLWAEAAGLNVKENIPLSWQKKWQKISPCTVPQILFDSPEVSLSVPRCREIAEKNFRTARQAVQDTLIVLNKYI